MCEFDKLDKTFASDLYLVYRRSPSARVCISDKDRLLMFYLLLLSLNESVAHHHLKTDTLETAIKLMTPQCFMTSVDLKCLLYYPHCKGTHKYLKFI